MNKTRRRKQRARRKELYQRARDLLLAARNRLQHQQWYDRLMAEEAAQIHFEKLARKYYYGSDDFEGTGLL